MKLQSKLIIAGFFAFSLITALMLRDGPVRANAVDQNTTYPAGMDAPASSAVAVTPSDSATLTAVSRGLYVGVTGNVTVDMAGGQTNVTFANVPVGLWPYRVTRVYATGTTATNIIALW